MKISYEGLMYDQYKEGENG